MNALLGLITDRGQKLSVSHGLKCGVQLRRKGADQGGEREESVGQFNLIGFVDDLSLLSVLGTPGASRCVLEETGEGRGNTHSQVEVILFWVNLKPKPIKPINHEQPTN